MKQSTSIQKRDRILTAFSKLNDRDTQRSAVDELLSIVQIIDSDSLTMLVSQLCSSAPDFRSFAKKECIKLAGIVTGPSCALQDQVIEKSHLLKILAHLKSRFSDADGGVRDIAAEVYGDVACNIKQYTGALLSGEAAQPMLKVLLSCFNENSREIQATAAKSLLQMSPHLGPLHPSVLKVLVKHVNNSGFKAAPTLMISLATVSPPPLGDQSSYANAPVGSVWGIVQHSKEIIFDHFAYVLGSHEDDEESGLLGQCVHKEWQNRRAGVETLRACMTCLGPSMIGTLDSIKDALERCRFDKVKPVRESVQECLQLLLELEDQWVQAEANNTVLTQEQWLTVLMNMANNNDGNTGDGRRLSSGGDGRRSLKQRNRPSNHSSHSARGQEQFERFQQNMVNSDVTLYTPRHKAPFTISDSQDSAQQQQASSSQIQYTDDNSQSVPQPPFLNAQPRSSRVTQQHHDSLAHQQTHQQREVAKFYGKSPSPSPYGVENDVGGDVVAARAMEAASTLPELNRESWTDDGTSASNAMNNMHTMLNSRIDQLEQQQAKLMEMMASLTAQFTETVRVMQTRLQECESSLTDLTLSVKQGQNGSGSTKKSIGGQALHSGLNVGAGLVGGGKRKTSRRTNVKGEAEVEGDAEQGDLGEHSLADGGDGDGVGGAVGESVGVGEEESIGKVPGTGAVKQPGPSFVAGEGSSAEAVDQDAKEAYQNAQVNNMPADIAGAYRKVLLKYNTGDDIALLRLMQKTGPCWNKLDSDVSTVLLDVLIGYLNGNVSVQRVLPWMWRLADGSKFCNLTWINDSQKDNIIQAMTKLQGESSVEASIQQHLDLLKETLVATWSRNILTSIAEEEDI